MGLALSPVMQAAQVLARLREVLAVTAQMTDISAEEARILGEVRSSGTRADALLRLNEVDEAWHELGSVLSARDMLSSTPAQKEKFAELISRLNALEQTA